MTFAPSTTRAAGAPKPKGRWSGFSFSKLRNFKSCPLRHYECDIAKKWNEGETNDSIEVGNAIHKAMEDRIKLGTPIPTHLQSLMGADMEAWCKKVLHGFADPIDYEKATGGKLGIELQLAIDEAYKPCDWFAKNVTVFGRAKIDVAKTSGNVGLLIDWKTGKISDRDHQQLLISAAVGFIHYPQLECIRTSYVWLKEDATTTLDLTRADMNKVWADLLPEINHYRASVMANEFPPRPTGLCGYCPVHTCSHNPRH